ncbi:hypothetical protein QRO11_21320 [Paracidovorax citrulli]|uniref:Lipoprotein n=2 Tax=Paracidovorax citrulli TaxID=80869 RepID=A1TJ20_PARC0|nr:hypothetical protein [Paracidovorax citrulli]ABM30958.1 conserved hypothetical protein [Paracidovorax citrulli AAC00-1]ATG95877.1 hypothetical protein CQB05_19085 [Paracidovorax citrulli]MVT37880.1 hypothetical protein [Paracidovorax citrulli]UEG45997.1 hypothetical protein LKW27_20495 [Paracidovorax citrulli]UMT85302.1 hypothetical protein FRC75_19085 [Paracidovorax citrulli]
MSRNRMLRILLAGTLSLGGCSPSLDWRSVRMDEAGLTALLPCKPERAVRPVELQGRSVELSMAGCDADGATFAVSHMVLPQGAGAAEAGVVLAQWRAATLARIGVAADTAGAGVPFTPRGALQLPQSVRLQAHGAAPGQGADVAMDAAWFARAEAAGDGPRMRLYHAVIYSPQPRAAVADTFFPGLALR